MLKRIRSIYTTAKLHFLKKDEFYNIELRSIYRKKYGIDVGLYTYGCFDPWRMPGPLTIGRYCSFAKTVRSTNNNHPLDAITTSPILYHRYFGVVEEDKVWNGSLVIEDDVWVGHNAVILPGCRRIGRGAVIGAGSIITRDVPPYAVMAGNPGRKLRDRFTPDLIEAIEASRWWEKDVSTLKDLMHREPNFAFSPDVHTLKRMFHPPTDLPAEQTSMSDRFKDCGTSSVQSRNGARDEKV